jgi:hypothetical protein
MDHVIRYLSKQLPGHEVALKSRPDGKLLMSLSQNGKSIYMKVFDPCTLMREKDLSSIVYEFKLNQKIIKGNVHREDIGNQLLQYSLPTFSGSPINPTAAKMLWKKRQAMPCTTR